MRLISFSDASAHAPLGLPLQAMTSWLARLRHWLPGMALPSAKRPGDKHQLPAFLVDSAAEGFSIDSMHPQAARAVSLQPAISASLAGRSRALRAVRVVRESDRGIGPDCAGRMVISGRMADVCAELDRMVELATVAK